MKLVKKIKLFILSLQILCEFTAAKLPTNQRPSSALLCSWVKVYCNQCSDDLDLFICFLTENSSCDKASHMRFYKVHAACQFQVLIVCLKALSLSITEHHCGLSPNSPLLIAAVDTLIMESVADLFKVW